MPRLLAGYHHHLRRLCTDRRQLSHRSRLLAATIGNTINNQHRSIYRRNGFCFRTKESRCTHTQTTTTTKGDVN